jgi:hypothetical protein
MGAMTDRDKLHPLINFRHAEFTALHRSMTAIRKSLRLLRLRIYPGDYTPPAVNEKAQRWSRYDSA